MVLHSLNQNGASGMLSEAFSFSLLASCFSYQTGPLWQLCTGILINTIKFLWSHAELIISCKCTIPVCGIPRWLLNPLHYAMHTFILNCELWAQTVLFPFHEYLHKWQPKVENVCLCVWHSGFSFVFFNIGCNLRAEYILFVAKRKFFFLSYCLHIVQFHLKTSVSWMSESKLIDASQHSWTVTQITLLKYILIFS